MRMVLRAWSCEAGDGGGGGGGDCVGGGERERHAAMVAMGARCAQSARDHNPRAVKKWEWV
jgi:hypothetical protein